METAGTLGAGTNSVNAGGPVGMGMRSSVMSSYPQMY